MDSSTITGSPACTASPSLAVTRNTTPVMWALISSGIEHSLLDHLGMDGAAAVLGVAHDTTEERHRRLHAFDDALGQGLGHALDGLLPALAAGDEFHEQRVVMDGHGAARRDAGFDPDAFAGGEDRAPGTPPPASGGAAGSSTRARAGAPPRRARQRRPGPRRGAAARGSAPRRARRCRTPPRPAAARWRTPPKDPRPWSRGPCRCLPRPRPP